MKHLLNMAKNGDQEEEASPMSDMQVKAKSDVLHQLLKESDMMAGNGISEGLGKKVTVAADSQEGLEEGLDVAEDVVEGDPMMDMMPEDDMGGGEGEAMMMQMMQAMMKNPKMVKMMKDMLMGSDDMVMDDEYSEEEEEMNY